MILCILYCHKFKAFWCIRSCRVHIINNVISTAVGTAFLAQLFSKGFDYSYREVAGKESLAKAAVAAPPAASKCVKLVDFI